MNTHSKYRPQKITDVVWANDDLQKEVMRYAAGRCDQPLVLHGPFGTGKTLIANLIPYALEGNQVQIRRIRPNELNSSDAVKTIYSRDRLFDDFFTPGNQSKTYTLMDEVCISPKAKHALRICLEEMEGRDLTIMTTNDLAGIDRAILSRAKEVYVPPIPPDRFLHRAQEILISEGVLLADDAVQEVLESTFSKYKDNREYYKALDKIIDESLFA